jgi:hypothetical protein
MSDVIAQVTAEAKARDESEAAAALVRAKLRSNNPIPGDDVAHTAANKAFSEDGKGRKLLGTACSRMAYAVMLHWANLSINGVTEDTGDLNKAGTSIEALGALRSIMQRDFVGKPDNDAPNAGEADVVKSRNARVELVKRGTNYAAILAMHGVTFRDFLADKGYFPAPQRIILKKDDTCFDGTPDTIIPLDGKGVFVKRPNKEGKLVPKGVNTSYDYLYGIHGLKSGRAPNGKAAQDNAKTATVKPTDFGIEKLIAASVDILCANDATKDQSLDKFPVKMRNNLATLAKWYHTMLAKQAAAQNGKPGKANKGKPATAAA